MTEDCSICQEALGGAITIINQCRHKFHGNCFFQWTRRNNTCPNCRIEITSIDNIVYINELPTTPKKCNFCNDTINPEIKNYASNSKCDCLFHFNCIRQLNGILFCETHQTDISKTDWYINMDNPEKTFEHLFDKIPECPVKRCQKNGKVCNNFYCDDHGIENIGRESIYKAFHLFLVYGEIEKEEIVFNRIIEYVEFEFHLFPYEKSIQNVHHAIITQNVMLPENLSQWSPKNKKINHPIPNNSPPSSIQIHENRNQFLRFNDGRITEEMNRSTIREDQNRHFLLSDFDRISPVNQDALGMLEMVDSASGSLGADDLLFSVMNRNVNFEEIMRHPYSQVFSRHFANRNFP